MTRVVRSKFQSITHKLDKESFGIFEADEMHLNVRELKEDSFIFEVSDKMGPELSDDEFVKKSHEIFNLFTVSINICTLGLFLVQENRYVSPLYELVNYDQGYSISGHITHDVNEKCLPGQTITSTQVSEALMLYGVLAKESSGELISEYLKGLIHLSLNYAGAHFEKDAFGNFYRTFEYLVTQRFLSKKRFRNEIKEISDVLKHIGMGAELLEEFRKLYVVRGSQAMHSQLGLSKVAREDVMKMKVFADVALYKVFKPIWETVSR